MSPGGNLYRVEYEYGCLFCKTSCEKQLVFDIENKYEPVRAISPIKILYKRLGGELILESMPLFPGYVFFHAPKEFMAHQLAHLRNAYKLLSDEQGTWAVKGQDAELISRLFSLDGKIGLSEVYSIDNRIQPVNGLLKDYEGKIVKVDRRKKKAQVSFEIGNRMILSWLGFEEIEMKN